MSGRKPFRRAQKSSFSVLNRRKVRSHQARPIGIEWLELRALLTNFNPWASAPDDPNNNHSLRAAIIAANASAGDDVITLQKGKYTLTATNTSGQENEAREGDLDLIQINHKVTIQGAGAGKSIIDAATIDRVFQIAEGVKVVFKNLTIRNGLAQDDGSLGANPGETDARGGGILAFGANLTLQNVVVECCTALGAPGATLPTQTGGGGTNAYGGGLFIAGGSQYINCLTVQNNKALGGDGMSGGGYGGNAYGGGIYATELACLTLTASKVLKNEATGGGTSIGAGTLTDQSGNAYGGGIASTSPVSLFGCLVTRNIAAGGPGAEGASGLGGSNGGFGGYAAGGGIWARAPVAISCTEVSCNSALGGKGGNGGSGFLGGGNGGEGGDGQGGGIFVDVRLDPGLSAIKSPTQSVTYAVSVKACSKVNQNTARGGDGGDGGGSTIGGLGEGARAGDGEGGGIYVASQFAVPILSTNSKTKAPPIPPALVIVDCSQVNSNHAIGGNDGSGGVFVPSECNARGGGIFVGAGEILEVLGPTTPLPTTLLAVSLNKSTVDCNDATAGHGVTPGGDGGEAQGGGLYTEGGVWASKSSVSKNTAKGGDGAQGATVTFDGDDLSILTTTQIPGGDGGEAQGGGIFNRSLPFITAALKPATPVATVAGITLIDCVVNLNKAIGGAGGEGITNTNDGSASDAGSGGDAEGGGLWTDGTAWVTNSNVSRNCATGGNGGNGGNATGENHNGGAAGNGGAANGGGVFAGIDANINCSTVSYNSLKAGNGGNGGTSDGNGGAGGRGGDANGGGVDAGETATITGSSLCHNTITAGNGGNGGDSNAPRTTGFGGNAQGGGVRAGDGSTVSKSVLSFNSATGGNGGTGAKGTGEFDSNPGGGAGGGDGGAMYVVHTASVSNSTLDCNTATGGAGGNGGDSAIDPNSAGDGGFGGDAHGGAIYSGDGITLTRSEVSRNKAIGGAGGAGGNGTNGSDGGRGGDGGKAQGGGLYSGGAINVSQSTVTFNSATGGRGGDGGDSDTGDAGDGGTGGDAEGGGAWGSSVTGSTIANNSITAGGGGDGGSPNGTAGNGGTPTGTNTFP